MKKRKGNTSCLSSHMAVPAALLLAALLTACGVKNPGGESMTETNGETAAQTVTEIASQTASQAEETSAQEGAQETESGCNTFYSGRNRYGWWGNSNKYTQADYEQISSYQTADYETMSVDAFNRMVMNWEEEEAFHKTEEAFRRIFSSLKEEDPLAQFVYGTLSSTWDECERKHYGVCQRQKNPWHNGEAFLETYGDVFGDKEFLTGSYMDYSYDYQIPDEQAVTVAQRDSILKGVDEGMQAFLQKQSQEALEDEERMEKAADEQLVRLLKALDGGLVWEGNKELSYYWNDVYDEENDDWDEAEEEGKEPADRKKQYDRVIAKLKFPGYEDMSISEFNRKINAAFSDYEEDKNFFEDYENVMEYLEDTDENTDFLRITVQASQEEYYARQRELYARKQVDPEYDVQFTLSREEDVFGDKMVVQMAEGYYTFTYRILDGDKLTVSARDAFLEAVTQTVKEEIDRVFGKEGMDESQLKEVVDKAGKAAGNSYIEYTGCEVDYMYMEDYGE